jgi:hypothetical protein
MTTHHEEGGKKRGGRLAAILSAPLLIAGISLGTAYLNSNRPTPIPPAPITSSSTAVADPPLPAADPVPDDPEFNNNGSWISDADDCFKGSMKACDILWHESGDQGFPHAHDYGLSCAGRRNIDSGDPQQDCTSKFPGHD